VLAGKLPWAVHSLPPICKSVAYHRVAWCAVQWRPWLGEARRTGGCLVASCPCFDPIKRREECRDYCDYHCNSEKHHSGTVAIPLVTHEGPPLCHRNATHLRWLGRDLFTLQRVGVQPHVSRGRPLRRNYSSISRSCFSSSTIFSFAVLWNASSAISNRKCRYFMICISNSTRSFCCARQHSLVFH
jgi:hypothetical protein